MRDRAGMGMLDFEVQRFSRKCSASGRELAPGETFYSALVPEGGSTTRLDFAAEAWSGPPANAIGWWKAVAPSLHAKRAEMAPGEIMLQYFEQLADDPLAADERYVLALLMIRRRILREERVEKSTSGEETWVLYCPRNEQEYHLAVAMPTAERAKEIQEKLGNLLYGAP